MRTKCVDVYKLSELPEKVQDKVVFRLYDINVNFNWWESTYEDASNVGIIITGFDIGRGQSCTGDFGGRALETANKILAEHGEGCETVNTAHKYMADREALLLNVEVDEDGEYYNATETALSDLDKDFLRAVLEDYRIILSKEYEYLTSEEQIRESIEANEMEFTIDGKDA